MLELSKWQDRASRWTLIRIWCVTPTPPPPPSRTPWEILARYAVIFSLFSAALLVIEVVYAWPQEDFRGMRLVAMPAAGAAYFWLKAASRKRAGEASTSAADA